MQTLFQDLRYAGRMLVKTPGFTAVAILTLALGIGANSAIFSVVNAVLLRPLMYRDSEKLVRLYEGLPQGGTGSVSVPNLKDWREQNTVFSEIAAYQYGNFNLSMQDQPERIVGANVSAEFFDLLGTSAQFGRTFQKGEDQPGSNRVVVLSDALWRRNFGADASLVGKNVSIGGENFSVIGIMPPQFKFFASQLWVPLVFTEKQLASRGSHAFNVLGRLKPERTLDQAREELTTIARRLEQQYPDQQKNRTVKLVPLQEDNVRLIRPALFLLLGAVGLVLLIACTNVANLLLARATSRRGEIAIRTALGAKRGRLIRQFLTESVLLSLLGGLCGLLLAKWGTDVLVSMATGYLPVMTEISLDWRVMSFTLGLSLLTGLIFGMAPAMHISKTDLQDAIKDGGSRGGSSRGTWLRGLLVVGEVAAALILLVGAGLLLKSFTRLLLVNPGFRTENVLTMRITLPDGKYKSADTMAGFYRQLLDRVAPLPGVEASGIINLLPVLQAGYNGEFQVVGQEPDVSGKAPLVEIRMVSPDYFRALGVPLVNGRAFDARDQQGSEAVAIVNQEFARRLIPNGDPLGKYIKDDEGPGIKIIGVVGNVKQFGLIAPTIPELYTPYTQPSLPGAIQTMTLVVRTAGDPEALAPALRKEVLSVDPAQPVYEVQTMQAVIGRAVSYQRLNMQLLGIFALLAMILAVIGIYSVLSYQVSQHTREIGIRMALGARPWHVLRLILREGLTLTLIGVVLGVAGAFALTRLLASLLFGVTASDPVTYVMVSLLLIFVALLACIVPARRATKVDPLIALRYE
ncbi:MAG TPA: ABC transporter permease [Pyrinomonadaceae bacterium]|jgi:putative ABC transport system permease protein|nr:ABC transporter permease [Pyrinomonadaceae bacterium]